MAVIAAVVIIASVTPHLVPTAPSVYLHGAARVNFPKHISKQVIPLLWRPTILTTELQVHVQVL